jgi:hypothetical protein
LLTQKTLKFVDFIFKPLLQTIAGGRSLDTKSVNVLTLNDTTSAADIIINNLDPNLDHPYHLHAYNFFIVGRGHGMLKPSEASSIKFNTSNPLRRDTLVVPRASWAAIRITNDIPGVWPLHCHIAWHLAQGFLGVVVSKPEEIMAIGVPYEVRELCPPKDSGLLNTTQPAKRRSLHRRNRHGQYLGLAHAPDSSL